MGRSKTKTLMLMCLRTLFDPTPARRSNYSEEKEVEPLLSSVMFHVDREN